MEGRARETTEGRAQEDGKDSEDGPRGGSSEELHAPQDSSDPTRPGNEHQDHEMRWLASEAANDDNEDS